MSKIHPQLLNDCLVIGRFPLCHLLLMRDANYPWFILVPDRDGITEIHQLTQPDQVQLIKESSQLARILTHLFNPDKLNIAALGNIVPQLHIHHVVRFSTDAAWPSPVWGKLPVVPYAEADLIALRVKIEGAMPVDFSFLAEH